MTDEARRRVLALLPHPIEVCPECGAGITAEEQDPESWTVRCRRCAAEADQAPPPSEPGQMLDARMRAAEEREG